MELQQQVCTLDQAKRLKELGVSQDSFFYHYKVSVNGINRQFITPKQFYSFGRMEDCEDVLRALSGEAKNEIYSAFTVGELGDMLPDLDINNSDGSWQYRPFKEYYPHTDRKEWKYHNHYTEYASDKRVLSVETEAQARAEMLIWLLENNLTQPNN